MIKVGVAGAAGRMGRAVIRAVKANPGLTLSSAWEIPGHPQLGEDVGILAGIEAVGLAVGDSAAVGLKACQVAMDFTTPEATQLLIAAAEKAGCALVIGTTGLSADQMNNLRQAGKRLRIVYATNFSVGVNLLWALARQTARILGPTFNAEIIEVHHALKKDAPSGTALTLLEAICQGRDWDPQSAACYGRQGLVGLRPASEVGVHAVRAGDIVGDHIALFAGPGERLEIKHQAHTRDTLAQGAVRAAFWIVEQPAGFYPMSDVLGIKF